MVSWAESRREAEAGQNGAVEPGEGTDAGPRHSEDKHAVGVRESGLLIVQIDAEGRLAVGPGRDQPEAPALPDGGEELGRQRAALVLQRHWRHGHPHVIGHQGNHAIHVPGLEGQGEPFDECPLAGRIRQRGWFLLRRPRKTALHGGAGPLERAGDRLLTDIEDLGCLTGVEAEDVAQDERGALTGRQQLQGGDEGQRNRLPGLVPGLRAGLAVGYAVQEDIGTGLEPDHFAQAGGLGEVEPGRR